MSATYKIRVFAARLAPNEMFHTSQVLAFGTRWAVDKALSRLVQSRVLHRLGRGLFIQAGPDALLVTAEAAARYKAAAFGNQIVEHATDTGHRLGIQSRPNPAPTFATSGCSSSFLFNGETRVYFKRASARKRQLSQTKMGDVVRALWQLGRKNCDLEDIRTANISPGRSDRLQLPSLAGLMPTWLHCRFRWHDAPRPKLDAKTA